MIYSRIYADFHNADEKGRLRLTCVGTIEDLATQGIQLHEGLVLTFYADDADDQGQRDDLLVEGVVSYAPEERCWVAAIDWNAIRHESDERKQDANGAAQLGQPPKVK
jgi:hypothetical protein